MLLKFYRIFVQVLCVPIFLAELFARETGREYGITFPQKFMLVWKMIRNNQKIISSTNFLELSVMAARIFKIPRSTPGVIVECGSYKGASATNLSLICALVGRRLEIFDSFQGLPAPKEGDNEHYTMHANEISILKEGSYCGSLDEVRNNIIKYGHIASCSFHKGFFESTLPQFHEKIAFIWVDVDLTSSLKTCLKYLWPLLQDDCAFFTHEAPDYEIASVFFDRAWWQEELGGTLPPGLIGAGNGIGLDILRGFHFSAHTGYTVKNPKKVRSIHYIGQKNFFGSLASWFREC